MRPIMASLSMLMLALFFANSAESSSTASLAAAKIHQRVSEVLRSGGQLSPEALLTAHSTAASSDNAVPTSSTGRSLKGQHIAMAEVAGQQSSLATAAAGKKSGDADVSVSAAAATQDQRIKWILKQAAKMTFSEVDTDESAEEGEEQPAAHIVKESAALLRRRGSASNNAASAKAMSKAGGADESDESLVVLVDESSGSGSSASGATDRTQDIIQRLTKVDWNAVIEQAQQEAKAAERMGKHSAARDATAPALDRAALKSAASRGAQAGGDAERQRMQARLAGDRRLVRLSTDEYEAADADEHEYGSSSDKHSEHQKSSGYSSGSSSRSSKGYSKYEQDEEEHSGYSNKSEHEERSSGYGGSSGKKEREEHTSYRSKGSEEDGEPEYKHRKQGSDYGKADSDEADSGSAGYKQKQGDIVDSDYQKHQEKDSYEKDDSSSSSSYGSSGGSEEEEEGHEKAPQSPYTYYEATEDKPSRFKVVLKEKSRSKLRYFPGGGIYSFTSELTCANNDDKYKKSQWKGAFPMVSERMSRITVGVCEWTVAEVAPTQVSKNSFLLGNAWSTCTFLPICEKECGVPLSGGLTLTMQALMYQFVHPQGIREPYSEAAAAAEAEAESPAASASAAVGTASASSKQSVSVAADGPEQQQEQQKAAGEDAADSSSGSSGKYLMDVELNNAFLGLVTGAWGPKKASKYKQGALQFSFGPPPDTEGKQYAIETHLPPVHMGGPSVEELQDGMVQLVPGTYQFVFDQE